MSLEGRIDIRLQVVAGGVADARIASSRPQLAQRLMVKRSPEAAAELAGTVFSLCGRSQRIAATVACAAADGRFPDAAARHGYTSDIQSEWVWEHAWHLVHNWPERAGHKADLASLLPLRRTGESVATLAPALVDLLTGHLLGESPSVWLERDWYSFLAWRRAGHGLAAILLNALGADPDPGAGDSQRLPVLENLPDDAVADLVRRAMTSPEFCARPEWAGGAAETGVLSRTMHEPLVEGWIASRGCGAGARLLARLVELARLPSRLNTNDQTLLRAWRLADGTGVAGVETSRGLLLHAVRLDGGTVAEYRIISPTEWNFHPEGALTKGLMRLPTDDRLQSLAQQVVLAFDPCVDFGVDIAHA
jgi:hypothetical protein